MHFLNSKKYRLFKDGELMKKMFAGLSSTKKDYITGYLFILPFYVFMGLFILVPICMNIYLSFTNYNISQNDFIGLDNYIRLFSDSYFITSLWNTAVYTFFTLFLTMVLSLGIALALRKALKGVGFFRTAFFVPHVISMVAASMVWLWIFEPSRGMANQFIGMLGIPFQDWLYDPNLAMFCIIFVSVWKTLGYYVVIYISGLQSIPGYLYEAARIDGASAWSQLRYITVPMLQPVTFFLFVTGTINCFKVFEQVQIMTNGGPSNKTTTIVHQIYTRAFGDFEMGYAAAMSIVLLFIIVIITLVNYRYGSRGTDLEA